MMCLQSTRIVSIQQCMFAKLFVLGLVRAACMPSRDTEFRKTIPRGQRGARLQSRALVLIHLGRYGASGLSYIGLCQVQTMIGSIGQCGVR
ncbi:hypothetical protein B0T17DRAFT_538249 [Bombardia bombarda]|uniref:Secreted protein n=1 Tax=Bombardia bombarda TaxID=252184 RepID=A0AA40BYU6_9PEZI|nr:hypothetical protein B0T17DRAFT_538249 [Bombardia bombarda]